MAQDHISYQIIASILCIDISHVTQGPKIRVKKYLSENELKKHSDLMCAYKNVRKSSSVHSPL